jgi:predicted HAD superfamily phosphohydrolase YqeG
MSEQDFKLIVYVDVDDTLVRSTSHKRIPMVTVVDHVRTLADSGAILYCWSSGGESYAKKSAEELGIAEYFSGFLPKPNVFLDDQSPGEWRESIHVHPLSVIGRTIMDYRRELDKK